MGPHSVAGTEDATGTPSGRDLPSMRSGFPEDFASGQPWNSGLPKVSSALEYTMREK